MEKEKKIVLVVEDERPLLRVIRRDLEFAGFEPIVARSVGQAIEMLKTLDGVDAVWLDHYLSGGGTGIEVVETMKSDDELKGLPIFVVSNTASDEQVEKYRALGITDYFVKMDSKLEDIVKDMIDKLN